MKTKKWLALLLTLVMALSIGLAGCGEKKPKIDTEQYLNVPMSTIRTFDWNKATDTVSFETINFVMDGLTRIIVNKDGLDELEKALAKDWKQSEDGLTWTFYLRDAKWADDEPVTAQQFVDGWLRLLDPDDPCDYASFLFDVKGAKEYNAGEGKKEDVGVKALDKKTLEIKLKAPTPYFIQLTAFKSLFPIRLDVIESAGKDYGVDPLKMVFNGPFVVKEYVKGSKIVYEKNPKYWDAKKVKLEKINMQYVEEEASRHQMFQAKKLDIVGARGDYVTRYKQMVNEGKLGVTEGYTPVTYYIIYNCETGGSSKLFKSPKVRLAFALALDRQDYIDHIYKRGYVAMGLIPPTLMIGDKEYRKEVPEPFKKFFDDNTDIKALFKEGVKDLGFDPEAQYTIKYLDSGTTATDKIFQDWYKDQWEKALGVTIELDVCADTAQYWDRVDAMEYDLCTYGWGGDFNDPETFFNLFTTGNSNNPGRWTSKKYDELYAQTKGTADNAKRLELFKEMEEILLVDECAIAPMSYGDKRSFRQTYVQNVMYTLFGSTEYKYAYTEGRQ